MSEVIFGGFLWAPSRKYWKEILSIIDKKYELIHTKKYRFESHADLERVIIKLYEKDTVPIERIKKIKIKSLKAYDPVCLNFYFRVKLGPFSTLVEKGQNKKDMDKITKDVIKMKRSIRKSYRDYIKNYKRDIILHISDNKLQTSFVDNLVDNYIKKINN